jgi:hypothetical protein
MRWNEGKLGLYLGVNNLALSVLKSIGDTLCFCVCWIEYCDVASFHDAF